MVDATNWEILRPVARVLACNTLSEGSIRHLVEFGPCCLTKCSNYTRRGELFLLLAERPVAKGILTKCRGFHCKIFGRIFSRSILRLLRRRDMRPRNQKV